MSFLTNCIINSNSTGKILGYLSERSDSSLVSIVAKGVKSFGHSVQSCWRNSSDAGQFTTYTQLCQFGGGYNSRPAYLGALYSNSDVSDEEINNIIKDCYSPTKWTLLIVLGTTITLSLFVLTLLYVKRCYAQSNSRKDYTAINDEPSANQKGVIFNC